MTLYTGGQKQNAIVLNLLDFVKKKKKGKCWLTLVIQVSLQDIPTKSKAYYKTHPLCRYHRSVFMPNMLRSCSWCDLEKDQTHLLLHILPQSIDSPLSVRR